MDHRESGRNGCGGLVANLFLSFELTKYLLLMDFSIGWCLLFELECIAACYSMVDQLTKGEKVKL